MAMFQKKIIAKIQEISVDSIHSNPNQPRKIFEPESLEQLARSIAANGLLQPIVVRPISNSEYQLIAGERRLMAVRMLKYPTISAIVRPVSEENSSVLALIENIQRENLNYFEEALAIQKLLDQLGESQQQLAARLGKKQSTIANKLRLLKFPEPIQEKILHNQLTERHARALLQVIDLPDLEQIVDYIASRGFNVSQTEIFLENMLSKRKEKRKSTMIVRDVRIFLNTIQKAIDVMKAAGVHAVSSKKEDDFSVTYTVTIPKSASPPASMTLPDKVTIQ